MQEARLKLQIWRLPPILIVQLKRFHYLNGKWIKSHKVSSSPTSMRSEIVADALRTNCPILKVNKVVQKITRTFHSDRRLPLSKPRPGGVPGRGAVDHAEAA